MSHDINDITGETEDAISYLPTTKVGKLTAMQIVLALLVRNNLLLKGLQHINNITE